MLMPQYASIKCVLRARSTLTAIISICTGARMASVNLAKSILIAHRTTHRVRSQGLRNSFVTSDLKSLYVHHVLTRRRCAVILTETVEILLISQSATHSFRDVDHAQLIHLAKNLINASVCEDSV